MSNCYYCNKETNEFQDRISIHYPENEFYAVGIVLSVKDVCKECREKHLKRLYPKSKKLKTNDYIKRGTFIQFPKPLFLECINILKNDSKTTVSGMLEVFERMNTDLENITIDFQKKRRKRKNERSI